MSTDTVPPFAGDALSFCIERVRRNASWLDSFPECAGAEGWHCVDDGGWVGGHWVGLQWLALALTGDQGLEATARQWAARLEPRQSDATTHDLGFLFGLSHVLGWRIIGDSRLKAPALVAARTLSARFNRHGQFFQAWGRPDAAPSQRGRAIIDTMMNLELLYWASQESGETAYACQASAHARTTMLRHIRPDFSTAHVTDYDPDSGAFLGRSTHQGLNSTSCWSRGQAWAIYGFAQAYRASGDAAFLPVARGLADYALRRLPPDRVPYWDYDSPLIPADARDSSAAAILGAGLLLLAEVERDPCWQARWHSAAVEILESLWRDYTSRGTPVPSILLHGTSSRPKRAQDQGLIYGDYYFLEGLARLAMPGILAAGQATEGDDRSRTAKAAGLPYRTMPTSVSSAAPLRISRPRPSACSAPT